MQEEQPFAGAPQRCAAELVGGGAALHDVVGEPGAPAMHEEVGKEVARSVRAIPRFDPHVFPNFT